MNESPVHFLSDLITDAHAKIQKNHAQINPVVSVSRKMRDQDIPADAITIDCLKTKKRILIILHDAQPGALLYQFCMKDEDPSDNFTQLALNTMTVDLLYSWMAEYFSSSSS